VLFYCSVLLSFDSLGPGLRIPFCRFVLHGSCLIPCILTFCVLVGLLNLDSFAFLHNSHVSLLVRCNVHYGYVMVPGYPVLGCGCRCCLVLLHSSTFSRLPACLPAARAVAAACCNMPGFARCRVLHARLPHSSFGSVLFFAVHTTCCNTAVLWFHMVCTVVLCYTFHWIALLDYIRSRCRIACRAFWISLR